MGDLSIKVTIGGRIYPITVKADEEEQVRAAAEDVEKNLKLLQSNYAVKDKQDLLAMTALQYSTRLRDGEKKSASSVSDSSLAEIEALIDSIL